MTEPTIDELVQMAYDQYYYSEIQAFRDYIAELDSDDLSDDPFVDKLGDALCSDVRDLLHNGNIESLFSPLIEQMTDEQVEGLQDRLHDDFNQLEHFCNSLAKLMIEKENR